MITISSPSLNHLIQSFLSFLSFKRKEKDFPLFALSTSQTHKRIRWLYSSRQPELLSPLSRDTTPFLPSAASVARRRRTTPPHYLPPFPVNRAGAASACLTHRLSPPFAFDPTPREDSLRRRHLGSISDCPSFRFGLPAALRWQDHQSRRPRPHTHMRSVSPL